MTPDSLREADARIRKRVNSIYIDPTGKAKPIYDGVIDPDRYCSATPRIMWILKEPWDNVNSSGGGWSLCSDLLVNKPISSLSQATFHPIIYIAFGLFQGVSLFDEMPLVRAMKDPEGVLRRLAFVNAKKLPGVTRGSYPPTIMKWYLQGRDVIREQISAYSPDIIFGCSPHLPAILDDHSEGWRNRKQSVGYAHFVWHNTILFVHVYHPGQTRISRKRYIDDALKAVLLAKQERQQSIKSLES